MSHKNVTDPLAYVAEKFGEIFNNLINSNVSDEIIDQILIEICKEAGTSPEQASACIRGSKESLRVVKNLKLGLGTDEAIKGFISKFVEHMVRPDLRPDEAIKILKSTIEKTGVQPRFVPQIVDEYFAQFHKKCAFDIIAAGVDQMIRANKTETQIYNILIAKALSDFTISTDSELYNKLENYIEIQLQLRTDGKIKIEEFDKLPEDVKQFRIDRLISAIVTTMSYPSNSVKDILELVEMSGATGMLPESICKKIWESFRDRSIKALEDIIDSALRTKEAEAYLAAELAFLKAH